MATKRPGFRASVYVDETTRALLPQRKHIEDEVVRIENVTCTQQTPKAILCEIDGDMVWIPQSMVDDDSEVYRVGTDGTLVVKTWFAKKAGLV